MSDLIERCDAPSRVDWLRYFLGKVGLGACICEGQEISAAADEIERLTAERDNARERFERAANLLVGIHALLYPPPVTLPDGRTFVFRPENPDPHKVLQTLSDRIRALPDEIAAVNAAKEQR